MDPVRSLRSVSRTFGPGAAREKRRLLAAIRRAPPRGATISLRETLNFLRAYPDDATTLRDVWTTIGTLPAAPPVLYSYSWGVVRRLVGLLPGAVEIEWDEIEDEGVLLETLDLLVGPGEAQGLEDESLSTREWFARCRPGPLATDLEFLIELLEGSGLPPRLQDYLYERCNLPLRYRGPDRYEVEGPAAPTHPQRSAIERGAPPILPTLRRPLGRARRGGQELIDVALLALCARKLEIYPLIHANPRDVTLDRCGRGVQVALIGTRPAFRSPLESLYVFLLLKNRTPIAYGPAAVFLGNCEMGINLFPEFRGGEIRYFCAQLMRVLHRRLGAERFHLTRYAMGEGNEEAIESGAFWFYRKLGFRASDPAVEALARREESRDAARPGYRSDRRTLRRLARTEASFDLSGGRRAPFDFGGLGVAQSRFVAREFGGDRAAAERRCATRIARRLGVSPRSRALRSLAPLLAMIPDLARWTPGERAALASIVRSKDAPSERDAARRFAAHRRLESALRSLARAGEPRSSEAVAGGGDPARGADMLCSPARKETPRR